jgi:hypothetical protein
MNTQQFWQLIEEARRAVADPADCRDVAAAAASLLSTYSSGEIIAAEHVLSELLADSYKSSLWAAAYVINWGCSDDAFDYFRGWLIVQGREVFERSVAEPDVLADLPVIRAAARMAAALECEDALYIARRAYEAATGGELPDDTYPNQHPKLDDRGWQFDFDDRTQMKRRMPQLTALFQPSA